MNGELSKSIEQKYIFVGHQQGMLLDWLKHCCIQDPQYYSGSISTLYFDTATFCLYDEKRNGDFTKSKVRLRWYSTPKALNRDTDIKCFLEVKRKYGTLRQKDRMELTISLKKLTHHLFSAQEIIDLANRAYELEYFPPGLLLPMALIEYDRYRFVEPQSNTRIALDANIRCKHVNTAYLPVLTPLHLGTGVLEVKGKPRALPSVLSPISFYFKKTAFSKYGQCIADLMQPIDKRR